MRIILLLILIASQPCFAGVILSQKPESIDPNAKYVFYSHGFIVEGDNPTPNNARWGVYDFPKIKQQLADEDYTLIAYHRPKGTDPKEFAGKLADDVLQLIAAGVEPKNIFLVGFSRGGAITIFTSKLLARDDITFIILAGCTESLAKDPELEVYGRVYSIIETSDELVGSCQTLIDRSKRIIRFSELSISTGKEHGAFYLPMQEWLRPVKSWIGRD